MESQPNAAPPEAAPERDGVSGAAYDPDLAYPGLRTVLRVIFVVAILNFVIFVLVASRIGGDAVNGTIESGRYFLRDHARLTEVSAAVFTYSHWHTYAVWVTHPLAMIAGLIYGSVFGSRPSPGA